MNILICWLLKEFYNVTMSAAEKVFSNKNQGKYLAGTLQSLNDNVDGKWVAMETVNRTSFSHEHFIVALDAIWNEVCLITLESLGADFFTNSIALESGRPKLKVFEAFVLERDGTISNVRPHIQGASQGSPRAQYKCFICCRDRYTACHCWFLGLIIKFSFPKQL